RMAEELHRSNRGGRSEAMGSRRDGLELGLGAIDQLAGHEREEHGTQLVEQVTRELTSVDARRHPFGHAGDGAAGVLVAQRLYQFVGGRAVVVEATADRRL